MFVFNISLVLTTNCWWYFSFPRCFLHRTNSNSWRNTNQHPCMARTSLHGHLIQFHYHGVVKSMHWTYQSGLVAYVSFCSHFSINPLPETSLTLAFSFQKFSDNGVFLCIPNEVTDWWWNGINLVLCALGIWDCKVDFQSFVWYELWYLLAQKRYNRHFKDIKITVASA